MTWFANLFMFPVNYASESTRILYQDSGPLRLISFLWPQTNRCLSIIYIRSPFILEHILHLHALSLSHYHSSRTDFHVNFQDLRFIFLKKYSCIFGHLRAKRDESPWMNSYSHTHTHTRTILYLRVITVIRKDIQRCEIIHHHWISLFFNFFLISLWWWRLRGTVAARYRRHTKEFHAGRRCLDGRVRRILLRKERTDLCGLWRCRRSHCLKVSIDELRITGKGISGLSNSNGWDFVVKFNEIPWILWILMKFKES